MNRKNRAYDDLTKIKYIGPKLQSWLREKLNVQTYSDLANLSTGRIQMQLKADKKSVVNYKLEIWLEEAKELASSESVVEEPNEFCNSQHHNKLRKGNDKKTNASDWREYASFMVYFEAREVNGKQEKHIKVSYLEGDKSKVWKELTAEHFLWMLNQAGEGPFLNLSMIEDQPELEKTEIVEEEKAEVKVNQIRLYQPPEAKKPLAVSNDKSKHPNINAGEPFTLEVNFSLDGEAAKSIVEQQASFNVQAIAHETKTKLGTDLGISQPELFVDGTFEYSIRTPEATLSPGEHQLWSIVTVQAANAIPSFLEGPSVRAI